MLLLTTWSYTFVKLPENVRAYYLLRIGAGRRTRWWECFRRLCFRPHISAVLAFSAFPFAVRAQQALDEELPITPDFS